MPNAFSPNLDTNNDVYGPTLNCPVKDYYFAILSLWGEVIFETTDEKHKWDGTYKGEPCQSDLYLYKLEYDGSSVTGVVNLLR